MKNWLIFGGIAAVLLLCAGVFISAANGAARAEAGIIAQHDNTRNVLGQYGPRIADALGVTKIQAKAVEDIITGANESRYGKTGSAATMQWITEQNPTLDQQNFSKIIDLIASGRNDFQREQTLKIDKLRAYKTSLAVFPGNIILGMVGYPSAGFFDKYEKIVVSGHAQKSFDTGIDDGLNLNGL